MKWSYYKHDVDMRHDSKILALRGKFGADGYAVWCMMLETLAGSKDLSCPWGISTIQDEVLAVDFMLPSERLSQIIDYCVLLGLLTLEDGLITCPNLNERVKDISDKRADAGRLGGLKRAENQANSSKCLKNPSKTKQMLENVKQNEANAYNKNKNKEEEKEEETNNDNNNLVLSFDNNCLSSKPTRFSFKSLIEAWNIVAERLALPTIIPPLSEARKQKVRKRTKEIEEAGYTWKDIFDRLPNMPQFYFGQNDRGWRMDLEWVTRNEENWKKIVQMTNVKSQDNGNQQSIDDSRIYAAINAGAAHAKQD